MIPKQFLVFLKIYERKTKNEKENLFRSNLCDAFAMQRSKENKQKKNCWNVIDVIKKQQNEEKTKDNRINMFC